jgi:hypothetical protein
MSPRYNASRGFGVARRERLTEEPPSTGTQGRTPGPLDKSLCRVIGLNQNFASGSGTLYHLQIEDRGPVFDAAQEAEVRRVNVIVYANYGEPNARIIHGRDYDFEDERSLEYNRLIERRIQELARETRALIDEREAAQVRKIKVLIHQYYLNKDEARKKELAQVNALFPFLFSRAWRELKEEQARPAVAAPPAAVAPAGEPEVVYPLDPELLKRVLEIERVIAGLEGDLETLRGRGVADDILTQTIHKLVARARESLSGRVASDFTLKRLDMTRGSLVTTWRQVRSRLRQA